MMLPTHALVGLAVALPFVYAIPEFGSIALLAGFLGGVFPDLDLYVGHRKTLHYPVYYSLLLVTAIPTAVLMPMPLTIGVGVFLLGAAVHCITDVFGGGLELRPWEGTSERAVYNHYRRQWIAPRRWVRYDGAPEDLLISFTLATPLSFSLEGRFKWLVIALTALAVVYSVVRRRLPTIADRLVNNVLVPSLPAELLSRVPDRYFQDIRRQPRRF